ncbi:unnamed protein product [Echinostoma caproni]|uniref:Pecanex-like protein n=1 Tax=Echinostoma caproni TaxID=27848 RepID=A0A183AHR7_9TREM|nr:unnamed protein product [Echinostoma caproni]
MHVNYTGRTAQHDPSELDKNKHVSRNVAKIHIAGTNSVVFTTSDIQARGKTSVFTQPLPDVRRIIRQFNQVKPDGLVRPVHNAPTGRGSHGDESKETAPWTTGEIRLRKVNKVLHRWSPSESTDSSNSDPEKNHSPQSDGLPSASGKTEQQQKLKEQQEVRKTFTVPDVKVTFMDDTDSDSCTQSPSKITSDGDSTTTTTTTTTMTMCADTDRGTTGARAVPLAQDADDEVDSTSEDYWTDPWTVCLVRGQTEEPFGLTVLSKSGFA